MSTYRVTGQLTTYLSVEFEDDGSGLPEQALNSLHKEAVEKVGDNAACFANIELDDIEEVKWKHSVSALLIGTKLSIWT